MSSKRKASWIAPSFDDFLTEDIAKKTKGKKTNKLETEVINLDDDDEFDDSDVSWVDKYAPKSEDVLAVHKKKVLEVKTWLQDQLAKTEKNKGGSILLLTGPSGCGKTACIRTMKLELGFDLIEWINPLMQEFNREQMGDLTARQESQSQLFHDFLLRANRYKQLSVESVENENKQIILIEDFPNFLFFDPSKMHNILRQYRMKGKSPLVFIMSDSKTDNYLHTLFPRKLQSETNITNISFNPVAQTSLTKTMQRIATKEADKCSSLTVPTKDVLDFLATSSNGDIRACINSLQFYCTEKNPLQSQAKKGKKTSRKRTEKSGNVEKIAGRIGDKDATLFLFRALGKILYCKREQHPTAVEEQLPFHLKSKKRNSLIENPEDVFEHTQASSEHFLMYLHQNYAEFFSSIDDVADAISFCVDGDVMSGVWDNRHIMNDYTSSLSMRGIMYSNKRPSSTGGSGGGWRPLHKPQWYDAVKSMNLRTKAGKDFLRGCRYANATLFTELLPYLHNMKPNNSLLNDISSLPLTRNQQARPTLNTLASGYETVEPFDSQFDSYIPITANYKESHDEYAGFLDELDDLIEDFDDE